ncbi:MAG: N-acetyltransferase family protein [Spirochaetia bacterium]
MDIKIIKADLNKQQHQDAVRLLLTNYAENLPGFARKLGDDVMNRLIPGLKSFPTTLILLAEVEGTYAGMLISFQGFSTFNAERLINIHDIMVLPEFRNRGVGTALLNGIEKAARQEGFCKLTLEVQEHNTAAARLYRRFGFEKSVLDENQGKTFFFSKVLGNT